MRDWALSPLKALHGDWTLWIGRAKTFRVGLCRADWFNKPQRHRLLKHILWWLRRARWLPSRTVPEQRSEHFFDAPIFVPLHFLWIATRSPWRTWIPSHPRGIL